MGVYFRYREPQNETLTNKSRHSNSLRAQGIQQKLNHENILSKPNEIFPLYGIYYRYSVLSVC